MPSLAASVPGFESFGLADYGVQRSWQGSLGIETPLFAGLSLDLTSYYQRLRVTDLRSIFNIDVAEPDLLEVRDGESYGVEVLLRRAITNRLWGWIAYTLSWSDRLVGFGRVKSPSDWDQRHIMNLVLQYRLPRGYSVGGRLHFNTGRPYPVYNEDTRMPEDYRRLPSYTQLDLRVDREFVFDRFLLDVYVEVINATRSAEVFDIRREQGVLRENAFRFK